MLLKLRLIYKMNIISISALSIVGVFLILLLREINSGYIIPVSVVLCGIILLSIYPLIIEMLDYSNFLITSAVSGDNIKILYKSIGTAFIVQYTSDLCRECKAESVSSKIEIAGRIYIISLCIPLVKSLIETVNNY